MSQSIYNIENEKPIDHKKLKSICEKMGRGIHTRLLNVLKISYGESEEGLNRLVNSSTTERRIKLDKNGLRIEVHQTNTPQVKKIGKKTLEAVKEYLENVRLT